MAHPTPPVRAALALLVLVTAAGAGASVLLLADRQEAAEAAARSELAATAAALAASLDPARAPGDLARRLTGAAAATGQRLAVLDARGRLVAASGPDLDGLNPALLPDAEGPARSPVTLGGEAYLLALASAPGGAGRVVALRPAAEVVAASAPAARRTVRLVALVWLVGVAGLGGLAWYAGRHTAARMKALAGALAASDSDPAHGGDAVDHLDRARRELGAYAAPFGVLAAAVEEARAAAAEAKSHVAALLQINPHYVLVCTLDGHIVDANPAFYAASGLPFEAVQGNRTEVLDAVMPVGPLFELARRSLREGASIGGVEYALVNRDDVRRPVQVSLRAVRVGQKDAVVIQATDVASQRNLERQVSTFSDALDLMVDQRVAQLTAGNASLSRVLDEAGVLVASFDEGGSTRRWSPAVEALTGRRLSQVPHFTAFTSVLGLRPEARMAFSDWFWGRGGGSAVVEAFAAAGPPRRLLWRKAVAAEPGRAERRVLVGVEVGPVRAPAGDGMGGAVPALDAVATP
jgi:PAS domain S-box-containing protein